MKRLLIVLLVLVFLPANGLSETTDELDRWMPIGLGSLVPSIESVLEREVDTHVFAGDVSFIGNVYDISEEDYNSYLIALEQDADIEIYHLYKTRQFFRHSSGAMIMVIPLLDENGFNVYIHAPTPNPSDQPEH